MRFHCIYIRISLLIGTQIHVSWVVPIATYESLNFINFTKSFHGKDLVVIVASYNIIHSYVVLFVPFQMF